MNVADVKRLEDAARSTLALVEDDIEVVKPAKKEATGEAGLLAKIGNNLGKFTK